MEINSDDSDTELDPRIQIELENLNSKTDLINQLEIDLENANANFRRLLTESSERLRDLAKRLGSCINKARPYHEAVIIAKHAQTECQKAALQFQRASEIHRAAKETVALAEQRFLSKKGDWTFDSAWQDMLNHATLKVTDAEKQKAVNEEEHKLRAAKFVEAERRVQLLEADNKRNIMKSQIYFNEKDAFDKLMNDQKFLVEKLQNDIICAKQEYSAALRRLECISDEIHCRRAKGIREPGVGAELTNNLEEFPLDKIKDLKLDDFDRKKNLSDENINEKFEQRSVEGEISSPVCSEN